MMHFVAEKASKECSPLLAARLSAAPPLDCCHGLMRPATRPAYAASCSMRTSCCTALARGDASTPSSVRLRIHRDSVMGTAALLLGHLSRLSNIPGCVGVSLCQLVGSESHRMDGLPRAAVACGWPSTCGEASDCRCLRES
jgi:hypothetical protein